LESVGRRSEARIAIIAMTTRSSIKVKPAGNADFDWYAKFVPDSILLGNRVMMPENIAES
jgi:hypothetical protein